MHTRRLHLSAAAAAPPSYSSSPSSFMWPGLFRVWWEVIGSESQQQQPLHPMDVSGWTQFVSAVLAQLGVTEIKVYHSFTERNKVRVDSETKFWTAARRQLTLSMWVCQPGRPSPPLYVDTSSSSVAEHRHIPPVMAPPVLSVCVMTPLSAAARVPTPVTESSSTTPLSSESDSPSSALTPSSSSSVLSPRPMMAERVKRRDAVCDFTREKPLENENESCRLLAACPLERRIDGEWW